MRAEQMRDPVRRPFPMYAVAGLCQRRVHARVPK